MHPLHNFVDGPGRLALLKGLRREAKISRQILTGQSLDPRRLGAELLPRHIGPPEK